MRRRIHRSFLRLIATFFLLSLFCSLLVFYSSTRLINDYRDAAEYNTEPRLQRRAPQYKFPAESENFNTGGSNHGFLLKDEPREGGRALQGYFEQSKLGRGRSLVFSARSSQSRNFNTYGRTRYLGCRDIRTIEIISELGHGYTKLVQKGILRESEVAVKSVQEVNKDVHRCLTGVGNRTRGECFNVIKYKLAKEIILLQQLKHPNIIKLLGFCWQNEVNSADIKVRGLSMVTELGQPLDVLNLLQLPWQERLRICLGLARLIDFMENSPIGSLIIRDFRHNQFVLVSGEIKLVDMDDVDNEDRACSSDTQCFVGTSSRNWTLQCRGGQCVGFNAAVNMINICLYFLDHILIAEAPHKLRPYIQDMLIGAHTLKMDSKTLVLYLERVVKRLQDGHHIVFDPRNLEKYMFVPESDFPALHDYYCDYSRSMSSCEMAVYSLDEAKYKCSQDSTCRAFVVTSAKTWIGYTIIYLKNDITGIRYSKNTSVFLKNKE